MSRIHSVALAGLAFALASVSWAASPDQVGDYAGTIKTTSYTEAGVKTSTKQDMLLSVAADDSTTVTIGGVVKGSSAITFTGSIVCFLWVDSVPSLFLSTGGFKNGKISGTFSGFLQGPPIATSSGKFKLKKQ